MNKEINILPKGKYLVDKYIFFEFLSPFLFSMGIFLCINVSGFVLFNLIDLMVRFGISFNLFFKLFVYSLPEMIFYSIPMSVLLASLMTSGRLFRDNETIIFQIGGRSSSRLFLPILVFVSFLCILSIIFNEIVVSKSNFEFSKDYFYAQMKKNIPFSKKNIFYKEFENDVIKRAFYAKEFNGQVMYKPVIEEFSNGELTTLINAQRALLIDERWVLANGVIYYISQNKYKTYANFEKYSFSFSSTLESISRETRTPKEMNFYVLNKHIWDLRAAGQKTSDLEVILNQKLSIPFSSLVFFFIGISLGSAKKSKNSSFSFAFSLVFIFSYYILMFCFTALGSINVLNPVISAWLPNIIVLVPGIYMYLKKLHL